MTRSILKTLTLTACAAAMMAAPMAASAQTATPVLLNPAHQPTTISLNATGEVAAAPDMATINFGVVTQAGNAATAMKNNNVKMNQVIAALKAAGIDAKDIRTSALNLSPQYDYSSTGGQPRLTGYQAQNQVTVRVNKLDQTGPVIDAVLAAGVNQIDAINFGLKDDSAAMDQARRQAVQSLRQRADLYASALGMKVKRVQTLSESGPSYNPPRPMMMRAEAAMDKSTPVAAGDLELSVAVSAVFELE